MTFTATGQPNTLPASAFKYRFLVNGAVRQNWSTNADYVMPATEPVGAKEILIESPRSTSRRTLQGADYQGTYTITNPPPATGVTLTPSLPSPQWPPTTVTFAAQGSSSVVLDPSAYQYQFRTFRAGVWTTVQPFGASSTWTMLNTSAGGAYTVQVRVRTIGQTTAIPAAQVAYNYGLATGVTFTDIQPQGPITAGSSSVIFTAAGTGGTGPYEYQFWTFFNGVWTGGTYSTVNTFTLPVTAAAGTWTVQVRVRTVGNTAGEEARTQTSYVLQ